MRVIVVDDQGEPLDGGDGRMPSPGNMVDGSCGVTVGKTYNGELILLVNIAPARGVQTAMRTWISAT